MIIRWRDRDICKQCTQLVHKARVELSSRLNHVKFLMLANFFTLTLCDTHFPNTCLKIYLSSMLIICLSISFVPSLRIFLPESFFPNSGITWPFDLLVAPYLLVIYTTLSCLVQLLVAFTLSRALTAANEPSPFYTLTVTNQQMCFVIFFPLFFFLFFLLLLYLLLAVCTREHTSLFRRFEKITSENQKFVDGIKCF